MSPVVVNADNHQQNRIDAIDTRRGDDAKYITRCQIFPERSKVLRKLIAFALIELKVGVIDSVNQHTCPLNSTVAFG